MRRCLSILFVLLFGLSPLAATMADDSASLPACCRRHGAHHFAMDDAATARVLATSDLPAFTTPGHCPLYPERGNAVPSHTPALPQIERAVSSEIYHLLPLAASTLAASSIYLSTASLRGPP